MRARIRGVLFAILMLVLTVNVMKCLAAGGYQTRIYPTTARFEQGYLKLSPDGKQFGFSYYLDGQHYVQHNSKIYGGFAIGPGSKPYVTFSPDGKNVVFPFFKEGKYYIQIGDREWGGYDQVTQPFCSKRGKFYGFKYRRRNKWYLWINGKRFGGFDEVGEVVFNAAETNYAFAFRKGSKWYLQSRKQKYGGFLSYWGPVFSLDGTGIGFIYQKRNYDQYYYLINDREYGPVDRVLQLAPAFDGQSFEVLYQDQGQFYLHSQARKDGPLNDLVFPGNTGRIETTNGIVLRNRDGLSVQLGDAIFSGLEKVQPIVCGFQRKLWGFGFQKDRKYYVQINKNCYGPFPSQIAGPYFSSNEKAYAFVYRRLNGQIVIQTNQKVYTHPPGKDFAITQLECSNNGRTIAIKFRNDGKEYIRVNEIVYGGRGTIDPDSLIIASSGKYFSYHFNHNDQYCFQINERVFKYDHPGCGDLVITRDNQVYFAQVKGDRILIQGFN